jgi:drug/metabolite transporter (DMT)-like permease
MKTGILHALLAAALFGASTPFAKLLTGEAEPLLLAGLLYFGSGIGLSILLAVRVLVRAPGALPPAFSSTDLPWLAGATLAGGVIGPVLLMTGLLYLPASSASLLLNMEGVLTAALAWFVFREQFDRRIFAGMVLIIAAGLMLSWGKGSASSPLASWGALSVVAACLCWAIDNNLTRRISSNDAVMIAAVKGLAAGAVNLAVALWWLELPLPAWQAVAAAGAIGFLGYGLSLVLFVLALRHLGTARTGAYFSTAPFVGAAISLLLLAEHPVPAFWLAAVLMAIGIWLHLTERHDHQHVHLPIAHSHAHHHDAHHQHAHDFAWDGHEPHAHPHQHDALTHAHPHFPDIHHRHRHKKD